jgi:hypothetical protein
MSSEQEAEDYVETTTVTTDKEALASKFKTKLVEQIYEQAVLKPREKPPQQNEMFFSGRMAFSFDINHLDPSSDIPTTVVRSKADLKLDVGCQDYLFVARIADSLVLILAN